jgi:2-amino-4-hydroxy-6-hydroxymethyldihydropteridine diphosphokinase
MGRRPGQRHGPRPIDVDVLLVGDRVLTSERLSLPHPELRGRRFVLVPVLELDPELRLPDGTPLHDCLASLPPGQRVNRVASLPPRTR